LVITEENQSCRNGMSLLKKIKSSTFQVTIVVTLLLSIVGCKKDDDQGPAHHVTVVELSPNTHWIQGTTSQLLLSASENELIFSQENEELSAVTVGDVLVSSIEENAPTGYMVRILDKQTVNGQLVFTVQPAMLQETFQELRFNFAHDFIRDDTAKASYELFDFDVQAPEFTPGFVWSSQGTLGAGANMNVQLGNYTLESVNMSANLTGQITNRLSYTQTASIESENELYTQPLTPFPVPGTPVVVVPKLRVTLGLKGSLEASVAYNASMNYTSEHALKYDNSGWHTEGTTNTEGSSDFSGLNTTADIKAYVQPAVELTLYGYDGLKAGLNSQCYLQLQGATQPTQTCTLKIGVSLTAQADLSLFGFGSPFETDDLFDFNRELYNCDGPPSGTACAGSGTVTDIDGNEYPTVSVGGKCWMAKNLETTRLNDGTTIETYIAGQADAEEWLAATTPTTMRWANGNQNTFGSAYNFYAVETGKLCPDGWRVPSYADLLSLYAAVGNSSLPLKSTGNINDGSGLWTPPLPFGPNYEGTNTSGFNAHPSSLVSNGVMVQTFQDAIFWSSTRVSEDEARTMGLWYGSDVIYDETYALTKGYACRCVQD
jgi:uncharacterized protein (TIGR02145 family)